jgi:hypothetical protein
MRAFSDINPPSLLPSFVSPPQLYAVLTVNSILVYDTQHFYPLAIVRNTHLASLTDAAWYASNHSTQNLPPQNLKPTDQ